MKLLVAVVLNAKEYPQKYHWNVMTVDENMQAHIIDKADFLLARPEYKKPSPGTIINTMAEATMI
jgi:hypothetical protein